MTDTNTAGDMLTDSQGRLVPRHLVKPEHLLEDELVRKLVTRADAVRDQIAQLKAEALEEIHAFMSLVNQQYGAKRGGQRGNITLNAYDGSRRILLKINDTLSFGPELQAAKALLDELLLEWSNGANDNIRAIILDAFNVDRTGRLAVDRILGLRRLSIEDDRWRQAMQAISDSIRVNASKEYVTFQARVGRDSYETRPLDIAKL